MARLDPIDRFTDAAFTALTEIHGPRRSLPRQSLRRLCSMLTLAERIWCEELEPPRRQGRQESTEETVKNRC